MQTLRALTYAPAVALSSRSGRLGRAIRDFVMQRRWAFLAGLVTAVGIFFLLLFIPRSGSLVVTVAGPGSAQISGVSVYVDGVERCNSSPCALGNLKPGSHLLRSVAPGFEATTERAVVVIAGQDVAYNFALAPKDPPKAGLEIGAYSIPVHVFVDGAEAGMLPVSLNGLDPKEHILRFEATDRYEPAEQRVSLVAGKSLRVDPPVLKLKRARLTVTLVEASRGATVSVDGAMLSALPATLDMDPLAPHEIKASLQGFKDYDREVRFDQALVENIEIALEPIPAPSKTSASVTATSSQEPTGFAALNLNSLPSSTVYVNGQSVGSTPKLGVRVKSGKLTIAFVHPKKGRKQVVVAVSPNTTKTVAVRF